MKWLLFIAGLLFLISCGGGETAVSTETPQEETVAIPVVGDADAVTYDIGAEADESRTFTIVPEESTAYYLVNEEFFADALLKYEIEAGEADVVGSTQEISGDLVLNFGQESLLEGGQFVVNLVSLSTDQNRRDNFIRDNHLESNQFPEATFVTTAVSGLPDTYTEGQEITFDLTGDLTIRDVTIPATFEVTAVLFNDRLTGVARFPITMSTFGIEPPNFANTLKVEDAFVIQVDFTAVADG